MREKRISVDLFYCVRYVPGLRRQKQAVPSSAKSWDKREQRRNRGALGFVIEARKEREGGGGEG